MRDGRMTCPNERAPGKGGIPSRSRLDALGPPCLITNVSCKMSANTWELDVACSPTVFLTAIARHLPTAHTASFEIRAACPLARRVYAQHRSPKKYRPLRDTISPRTHL